MGLDRSGVLLTATTLIVVAIFKAICSLSLVALISIGLPGYEHSSVRIVSQIEAR